MTDIAIVGGGLAGSLTAAMLGRAGVDAVLVDPHPVYPPDFRCEKLDGAQAEILRKTGLAEGVLRAATPDRESWVARCGRLVEKRPGDQHGIFYAPLVNTIRGLIPPSVPMIHRQGDGDRDRRRTADDHLVERRDNFGAAGRAGERTEYQLAPFARAYTRTAERMPLDQRRLRR